MIMNRLTVRYNPNGREFVPTLRPAIGRCTSAGDSAADNEDRKEKN